MCKPNEITQGFTIAEFLTRRNNLMEVVKKYSFDTKTAKNNIIVIPSATTKYMSDKIPYIFRQNSDFYYLTGCLEPDSILMLVINDDGSTKSPQSLTFL